MLAFTEHLPLFEAATLTMPFIQQEKMFILLCIFFNHSFYYPDIALFLTWAVGLRNDRNVNAKL